ncbi:helix-turn-helix domain-containing protein [Alicyclobacillus cycloheptanicus]|uniref:helix-turn-helix domain-containing protein n=1 Tax=Alicyclobacillus cycloheptanicus TaxID=1457 RepID=UPI00389906A5
MAPEEIAVRLRVSSETVRRWCRSGRLTAYRVGRHYIISERELEKFLWSTRQYSNQSRD